jgi:hypothetical protein
MTPDQATHEVDTHRTGVPRGVSPRISCGKCGSTLHLRFGGSVSTWMDRGVTCVYCGWFNKVYCDHGYVGDEPNEYQEVYIVK